MNFKEIQELIRIVSKSDLAEFKIKEGEFELTLKTSKSVKSQSAIPVSYVPSQPTPVHQELPVATKSQGKTETSISQEGPSKIASTLLEIKSPMVGTFYRSSGPDKPPFVKIGDAVDSGTTVCIIEAMKLFNESESEVKGTIVKILVEDSSPIEYDQVLFLVEP